MGKKLNPSSMKISKQEEKNQLNNMIKVLRPKVYITDSSSFKMLVQELTGCTSTSTSISISNPSNNLPLQRHHIESPEPVIEVQDDGMFQETSFEFSYDSGNTFFAKQETEYSSRYRDIESWLLEIDQFQNYDVTYESLAHPEVCFYDYDISELI